MPLPPALVSKLQKRGIIAQPKTVSVEKKKLYKGSPGCPNKSNIYHECTFWCDTHWKGVFYPDPKYLRNMQRLLQKYPLPHNWTEVFDKGLGRYYYWQMDTDMVSWLPPKHPKCVTSEPAAKLREKVLQSNYSIVNIKNNTVKDDKRKLLKGKDKEKEEKRSGKFEEKDRPARKKIRKDGPLDPMDPAAYSDIPQGTWSDGLENNRTRADNTASGPLYQQRPYPAPGEVLAGNKQNKQKSKANSS